MPELTVLSPGRINIIGEHTDYNHGFVLPAAIDCYIEFKFNKNESRKQCVIKSLDFNEEFLLNLNHLKKQKASWKNYLVGVLNELNFKIEKIQGFNCSISSNLPIGSGLSSSAALSCGFAFGLNELFNLKLTKWDIIDICVRAEQKFTGTNCGVMDQFASVMGKPNLAMLLDCRTHHFKYIPLDFGPYELLLLNSNVVHNLATTEYNLRREECKLGLIIIKNANSSVNTFQDVNLSILNSVKSEIDRNIYQKCLYVVKENQRVLKAVEALKTNDIKTVGMLMYDTHNGLSSEFQVSCKELDFLVSITKNNPHILGARMMGGGFGGCTLNIIHKDHVQEFISSSTELYFKKFKKPLDHLMVVPHKGTHIKN